MSTDDPWDWSIERVVKELCTADRSWRPRGTLTALPSMIDLDTNLRDEGIDGCILLCDITEDFMKQDLGLTKLAWRVFVRGAFEQLRIRSEKYKQHILTQHSGVHHTFSCASVEHQLQPEQILPATTRQPQHQVHAPRTSVGDQSRVELPTVQDLVTSTDGRSARGEFVVSDVLGNKRRKLDLTNVASNLALQTEDEPIFEPVQLEHPEIPQAENDVSIPTPDSLDFDCNKRKRIAPIVVSTMIDPERNRDLPTAADDVIHHDQQKIEPGVVFRGDDGKKRLVPVHLPDGNSDEPYDYQALLQKPMLTAAEEPVIHNLDARNPEKKEKQPKQSASSLSIGYLGKNKMAVDDIFYDATPVGKDLSTDSTTEFSLHPKTISGGRRLYMHRVMRRYFNAEHTILLRNGTSFSAIRPYPSSLLPARRTPSFTLFYKSEDGKTHARREELQQWPEIDPEAHLPKSSGTDANSVTFNTSLPGILDTIGSHDPLDPDLLEKYNHLEGGNEVLPLYGESGKLFDWFWSMQSKSMHHVISDK